MADIGLSQARQVENLGHSPAGQTGAPTGSSGNAYGAALDKSVVSSSDSVSRPAKRYGPLSTTGTGTPIGSREESVNFTSISGGNSASSVSEQQRPTLRKP
jgi:hypothetical protein